jgi:hypothetical protein
MRALSVRQPYAWLIVAGLKDVENRSRRLRHRGPLLIHASIAITPLREIEERFGVMIPESALQFGGVIGVVDLIDCVEAHPSPWFEGPFGLVLRNARSLPFAPMPGKLGLFSEPERLSQAVAEAMLAA